MTMLKIRQFRISDYAGVRTVWEESGLELRPGDTLEEVRRKLRRDPEFFLVALSGARIVGTVLGAWDGRRGWLYHLGVLPPERRKGVATALVKEVVKRMKERGVLKVNAVVMDDNEKSLGFFKKMGFEADRRSVLHGRPILSSARRTRTERSPQLHR